MKGYKSNGILDKDEIKKPSDARLKKGPVVIIECVENIPCNPCVAVCPLSAIEMEDINDTPDVDHDRCTGCGICVTECPGLAIFVIDCSKEDHCLVTVPYEYLPVPEKGDTVVVLDREGNDVGEAEVVRVRESGKTYAVTLKVEPGAVWDVRGLEVRR